MTRYQDWWESLTPDDYPERGHADIDPLRPLVRREPTQAERDEVARWMAARPGIRLGVRQAPADPTDNTEEA